jgi:hypothetical protein
MAPADEERRIERRHRGIGAWEGRSLADGALSNGEFAGHGKALNHQSRFIFIRKQDNSHR